MKTLKFKTNIKCSGCVDKVTPFLDEWAGKDNWKVDVQDPYRILTVVSEDIQPSTIRTALEEAGYKGEPVGSN
ncbi:MAG: heavy-metal-associated domain-containing protein [Balneolales bacterium]